MAEVMLRVGEQGRMVIPSELRKALSIEVGTELIARVEGDRLILETPSAILASLQAQFAQIPESMAEELIAARRTEVEGELCN